MAGAFQPSAFQPSAFQAGGVSGQGSFTANAVLKLRVRPTFTADAQFKKKGLHFFTGDAYIRRRTTKSVTADARLRKAFTANAVLRRHISVNAVLRKGFTANALLKVHGTPHSFTIDAAFRTRLTSTKTFTANAILRTSRVFGLVSGAAIITKAGQRTSYVTADAFLNPLPGDQQILIWRTGASAPTDYSTWLYVNQSNELMVRTRALNVPATLAFSLENVDPGLVSPVEGNRIQVFAQNGTVWFTGYITATPNLTTLGQNGANPIYGYACVASDESIRLEWQTAVVFPTLAPFANMTQGQIIAAIIKALNGGGANFDTSNVQSGITIPFFRVRPDEGFWSAVQRLTVNTNMKLWFSNGAAYFAPFVDSPFGYSPDELDISTRFDPFALTCTPVANPVYNDVMGVGSEEPQCYCTEYFVGDGYTANFPLKMPLYGGTLTKLLEDNLTGAVLSAQNWNPTDYIHAFQPQSGCLVFLAPQNAGGSPSRLTTLTGLEMSGALRLDAGRIRFLGDSDALIGCIMRADSGLVQDVIAGFWASPQAFPSNGITNVQALLNGQLVGPVYSIVPNKTYLFRLEVDCSVLTRRIRPYSSLYNTYGGTDMPADATVSWTLFELPDTMADTPTAVITYSVDYPLMPGYLFYTDLVGPMRSYNGVNMQVNLVDLYRMPYAEIWCKPDGAQDYVRQSLGDQNDPIASCAIVSTTDSGDQLGFFNDSIPDVRTRIMVVYRSGGIPRVRVQRQSSVRQEALAAGDSGIRAAMLPMVSPAPQNCYELERAIQAYIDDHTNPLFQGTWTFWSNLYPGADPVPGRFITINVPTRYPSPITALVQKVESHYNLALASGADIIQHIVTFAPLTRFEQVQVEFQPPDESLQGQLDSLIAVPPVEFNSVGTNFATDRPTAYFDDVGAVGVLEFESIPNFDFEQSASLTNGMPPNWQLGGGSLTVSYGANSPLGGAGNRSAKLEYTDASRASYSSIASTQVWTVVGGEQYQLTLDANCDAGAALNAQLRIFNAAGVSIAQIQVALTGGAQWQTLTTGVQPIPTGGVTATLNLGHAPGSAYQSNIYVDNVKLQRIGVGGQLSIDAGAAPNTALEVRSTNQLWGSGSPLNLIGEFPVERFLVPRISNDVVVYLKNVAAGNVVPNPGFELNSIQYPTYPSTLASPVPAIYISDNWQAASDNGVPDWLVGLDASSGFVHGGTWCALTSLRVSQPMASGAYTACHFLSNMFPVNAGDSISFGGSARWDFLHALPAGVTGAVFFAAYFFGPSGNYVGQFFSNQIVAPNDAYAALSATVNAPVGASQVRFDCIAAVYNNSGSVWSPSNTPGYLDARFDDVYLEDLTSGLLSRFASMVRVNWPVAPVAPTATVDTSDPTNPIVTINEDILNDPNLYGLEIRAADNATVLYSVESIAMTVTDLSFEDSDNQFRQLAYYVYAYNILKEYSPAFLLSELIATPFITNLEVDKASGQLSWDCFGDSVAVDNTSFEQQGDMAVNVTAPATNQQVAKDWIADAKYNNQGFVFAWEDAGLAHSGNYNVLIRFSENWAIHSAVGSTANVFWPPSRLKVNLVLANGSTAWQQFFFQGWARWDYNAVLPAGVIGQVGLWMNFYDAAGNFLGDAVSNLATPGGGWQFLKGVAQVPTGAVLATLVLGASITNESQTTFNSGTNLYMDARFDDVAIFTGQDATFLVEVDATDETFQDIVLSQTTTNTFLPLDGPTIMRQRYFRVTPSDSLGSGAPVVVSHVNVPDPLQEWDNTYQLWSVPAPPSPATNISVPGQFAPFAQELIQEANDASQFSVQNSTGQNTIPIAVMNMSTTEKYFLGFIVEIHLDTSGNTRIGIVQAPGAWDNNSLFDQNGLVVFDQCVVGTTYHFRAAVIDQCGNLGAWMPWISVLAGDDAPPSATYSPLVTTTQGGIRVNAQPSAQSADIDHYEFYWSQSTFPDDSTRADLPFSTTGVANIVMSATEVAFIWVAAVDTSGNRQAWVFLGGYTAQGTLVNVPLLPPPYIQIDNWTFEASQAFLNGAPPGWQQDGGQNGIWPVLSYGGNGISAPGTQSLFITAQGSGNLEGASLIRQFSIKPGEYYRFNVDVWLSDPSAQAYGAFIFMDVNGNWLGGPGATATGYAQYFTLQQSGWALVPAGAVIAKLGLWVNSTCPRGLGVAYDNVQVERATSLDETVDGTRAAWDTVDQKAQSVDINGNLLLKNVGDTVGLTYQPTTASAFEQVVPEMQQTVITKGNRVLLTFSGSWGAPSDHETSQFQFARDDGYGPVPIGAVIPAMSIFGSNSEAWYNSVVLTLIDPAPAGLHTYSVLWAATSGSVVWMWGVAREFQLVELG